MGGNQHIQGRIQSGFKPWKFLIAFLVVFFLFAVFLFAIDFVPESPKGTGASGSSQGIVPGLGTTAEASVGELQKFPAEQPVRVQAASVGINTLVVNPASTDINVLDSALLKGAVRYPESALLGEVAPMYLFGHQSYLPVVRNQAFKAFNGLQKLKTGDDIVVYSMSAAYRYRVRSIELVKAEEALIDLSVGTRTLVLTTCDSFGTPSDRYVVKADFVSRTPLATN